MNLTFSKMLLVVAVPAILVSSSTKADEFQNLDKSAREKLMANVLIDVMGIHLRERLKHYSNLSSGLGGGMYSADSEIGPVVPMVKQSAELKALEERRSAANQTLDSVMTYRNQLADTMADVDDEIRDVIMAAETSKTPPQQISAKMKSLMDAQALNQKAMAEARTKIKDAQKELSAVEIEESKLMGSSKGWMIDDSAESKKHALEYKFSCPSDERMVSRNGFGSYTWACLNSKGLITKKADRFIGMPEYDSNTEFDRSKDGTIVVRTRNAQGQVIAENFVKPKERTTKIYSGGELISSCSQFDEPAKKAANGFVGMGGGIAGGLAGGVNEGLVIGPQFGDPSKKKGTSK